MGGDPSRITQVLPSHATVEPPSDFATVNADASDTVGIDPESGTRSATTIKASGSKTPRQQAEHKTVPDLVAMASKNPRNAGAIHTGHSVFD